MTSIPKDKCIEFFIVDIEIYC